MNPAPFSKKKNKMVVEMVTLLEFYKGVYPAGDIRDKKHRQITTAVGEGSIAALEVIHKA